MNKKVARIVALVLAALMGLSVFTGVLFVLIR